MNMPMDAGNNAAQIKSIRGFTETNWNIIRRHVKVENEVGSWNRCGSYGRRKMLRFAVHGKLSGVKNQIRNKWL